MRRKQERCRVYTASVIRSACMVLYFFFFPFTHVFYSRFLFFTTFFSPNPCPVCTATSAQSLRNITRFMLSICRFSVFFFFLPLWWVRLVLVHISPEYSTTTTTTKKKKGRESSRNKRKRKEAPRTRPKRGSFCKRRTRRVIASDSHTERCTNKKNSTENNKEEKVFFFR